MPFCQIFYQKLKKIEEKTRQLEEGKKKFLETGDEQISKTFKKEKQIIENLIKDYQKFAYPEYQTGQKIFLLEKEQIKELKDVIQYLKIEDNHVIKMDLSEKDLSSFFEKDPYFLRKFTKLKIVNLSNCSLPKINSEMFNEDIEEINVWGNEGIKVDLKKSKKLKKVNLSNCNLIKISSKMFNEDIEEISVWRNKGIKVDSALYNKQKFPKLTILD